MDGSIRAQKPSCKVFSMLYTISWLSGVQRVANRIVWQKRNIAIYSILYKATINPFTKKLNSGLTLKISKFTDADVS